MICLFLQSKVDYSKLTFYLLRVGRLILIAIFRELIF